MRIEDYAIIGDGQTAAIVGRNGSVDWLCFPRFDSGACFSALLGDRSNGRFRVAPRGDLRRVERRYRDDTLVLETEMETEEGTVRLVDFMPMRGDAPDVIRIVQGVRGRVSMQAELIVRYDYGHVVPWVRRIDGRLHLVAGPDALLLCTPVECTGKDMTTVADFTVGEGERVPFVLTWHPSYCDPPPSPDPFQSLEDTETWWRDWVRTADVRGPYRDAVVRSLVTLKSLIHAPTGGIVAAATTSLPEALGGMRNWDYRYSWLRDATFVLECLLRSGYRKEAGAWRDWLLRAIAGDPAKLQIMYGVAGERRLDEREIEWLAGYEGSTPVRVGNAAAGQLQLDVYGETIEMLHQARRMGLPPDGASWRVERAVLEWLEGNWSRRDEGLWEIRADRQRFTHSKVMTWVAFDRAVKAVERFGVEGPIDRWRAVRDEIHADVCKKAFDEKLNSFTQAYGSDVLDASVLLIPIVGFLPPDDPRVLGTIERIQCDLTRGGFVLRYPTHAKHNVDGVKGKEGAFIACTFWLVDALTLAGRRDQAREVFERALAIRNDVGLLSEEYDVKNQRLVGNFPQAFSHVGLVNSARNLVDERGPAESRRKT